MTNTPLASVAVDIGAVQTIRKLRMLLAIATVGTLFVFGAARWSEPIHEMIEWAGLVLIFICIGGRCWCALYIGGRKNHELVTTGPYSITRNPLYLFSIVGATGVGAQFGGISIALLAGLFVTIIHLLVVRQEERLLLAQHGEIYRQYLAEVPRLLPDFLRWNDVDVIEVQPRPVVTTFLDACLFLASVPIAESLEYFQRLGYIHIFLRLP
jgi:protein-S-isoprenylcysteine O-methyltransferase Ste14